MISSIFSFFKFIFFVGFPYFAPLYLMSLINGWMFLFYPIYVITGFIFLNELFNRRRPEWDTVPHRGEAGYIVITIFFPSIISFLYFLFKYYL